MWFFSTPTYAGSFVADAKGVIIVKTPGSITAGSHRVVVMSGDTVVGWSQITVTGLPATGAEASLGIALGSGILLPLGGAA
ncbi:hypothetical protein [Microbacterium sp. GXF7504]